MYKSIALSSTFHLGLIAISIFTLPFVAKKPLDLPPIISVDLIQISDVTNIPYAPKASKIIEKVKQKEEKLLSEQAPPKKIKEIEKKDIQIEKKNEKVSQDLPKNVPLKKNLNKDLKQEKSKAISLPKEKTEKIVSKEEKKQKPSKNELDDNIKKIVKMKKPNVDEKVKQVSEFEKKELFDPNSIAALIDKSKVITSENNKKNEEITQSKNIDMDFSKLTLSEEDALKAQIFGCWSIPLGLPYNENLLVRIKLKLKPDGTLIKSEILDHARMNMPGQGFYKVLAESALRAIQLCQPLKVPNSGYERWKDLQLNFDAREMIGG